MRIHEAVRAYGIERTFPSFFEESGLRKCKICTLIDKPVSASPPAAELAPVETQTSTNETATSLPRSNSGQKSGQKKLSRLDRGRRERRERRERPTRSLSPQQAWGVVKDIFGIQGNSPTAK